MWAGGERKRMCEQVERQRGYVRGVERQRGYVKGVERQITLSIL